LLARQMAPFGPGNRSFSRFLQPQVNEYPHESFQDWEMQISPQVYKSAGRLACQVQNPGFYTHPNKAAPT